MNSIDRSDFSKLIKKGVAECRIAKTSLNVLDERGFRDDLLFGRTIRFYSEYFTSRQFVG